MWYVIWWMVYNKPSVQASSHHNHTETERYKIFHHHHFSTSLPHTGFKCVFYNHFMHQYIVFVYIYRYIKPVFNWIEPLFDRWSTNDWVTQPWQKWSEQGGGWRAKSGGEIEDEVGGKYETIDIINCRQIRTYRHFGIYFHNILFYI